MATVEDGGPEATAAGARPAAEEALALGPQPLPELIEYRRVDDAATMKALGDPLRLHLMRVLGRGARVKPRIMTVKQLAEELGEPTTKLYRHIKQLLAVELIQVAELRLVGGIVEQSFRVAQAGWGVDPGASDGPREPLASDALFDVVGAAATEYFSRYETALGEGRTFVSNEDNLANPPYVRSVGMIGDYRFPRERAADFAERLHALVKEFADGESSEEADSVSANQMVMFYATAPEAED
jgi:DNA-binding transcriptional ArsR family regulator